MNVLSCLNKINFPEIPLCDTCKSKIDYHPFRHLLLENEHKTNQIVFFHYFFPCWDVSFITRKYYNQKIVQAGFTFDCKDKPDFEKIRNFQQNVDLWIT